MRRNRLIRELEQAGDLKHWTSRARRQRWLHAISERTVAVRDYLGEKRQDLGLVRAFLSRALATALGASLLVVAVELIAVSLLTRMGLGGPLTSTVARTSYEGLVIAIVGAEVFFLAMFYTTLGVIASTSYQSVPGEVRQLFVMERGNTLFTRSVVRTLIFGLLVLGLNTFDYEPRGLTIAVLLALTLMSVLNLAVLGTGLFNFFDLSSLSTPLPRRLARAVTSASVSRRQPPNEARQRYANRRASEVLRLYRHLTVLLTERVSNETVAPRRVLRQLLALSNLYASLKTTIPSHSLWYERTPSHRNWLTLDHNRLSLALQTRTGVQPDLIPDRLWVEREVARMMSGLLPLLLSGDYWREGIGLSDEIASHIGRSASQLQVEEGLLLYGALTECLDAVVHATPDASADPGRFVEGAETQRLAAAERSVMAITAFWLGFVDAARRITLARLEPAWDRAVEDEMGPYQVGAPRELLKVLEEVSAGIALERRVEGFRVTPRWWVHHYAARALSRQILEGMEQMLGEVDLGVVARIEAISVESDAELGTLLAFDALQLISKLNSHLPVVEEALEELRRAKNEAADDEQWPEEELPIASIAYLEERVLRYLSRAGPALSAEPHDDSQPDLFGQAYKVLFDATFDAILQGRHQLARDLFPDVVLSAERARKRLVEDLSQEHDRTRFIYGTEPMIDLMELSGYALLMQELDGAGVWDDVRQTWDSIVETKTAQALAVQMASVLRVRESIFALTQGGIERTSRKMKLNRLLRDRGITEDRYWNPFGSVRVPSHSSAVVRVFAPDDMGSFEELEDLFLVEYLVKQPGCEQIELPRSAESLKDHIERERDRDIGAPGQEVQPAVNERGIPSSEGFGEEE